MKPNAYSTAKSLISLFPAVRTTGAVTGSAVTWGDCMGAMASIQAGTIVDGTHVAKLQHSDDNSTWADVPTGQFAGTVSLTSTTDESTNDIGYKGVKPYLRVVITSTAATTGGPIGASIVKMYPTQAPLR